MPRGHLQGVRPTNTVELGKMSFNQVQAANTTFMRENVVTLRVLEHELGAKNAWLLPVPSRYVRY